MAKRESGGVAMSGQICLKWNSFLNNIATSFESLWEEEGLVDVTLASDGQCLTAHKVILSASSPFFKKVFQTNPCQHPVIILQDVHFSELEAILIFIYKGEVNIEQKNLPALLKAAETLQIRGLSGSEIFAKESYKRLIDLERTGENDDCSITRESEECPEKRQKVAEISDDTILETALLPCISRSASVSESTSSEICFKDEDLPNTDSNTVPNPVYHRLEMKIEPYEITAEELQKQDMKEELERLDTGQNDETQVDRTIAGTSRAAVTIIAEARDTCRRNEQASSREIGKLQSTASEMSRNSPITSRGSVNHAHKDCPVSLNFSSDPRISQSNFSPLTNPENSEISEDYDEQTTTTTTTTTTTKGGIVYPPFPCPFCDRAYASWGFRRRHIKAVHTISPRLNCKWCLQVLPTHAAWRRHVISAHNLSASDAHNGLLILEEAHMVLQIAHPTRLDTLVNIIKQNSQQSSNARSNSEPHPD